MHCQNLSHDKKGKIHDHYYLWVQRCQVDSKNIIQYTENDIYIFVSFPKKAIGTNVRCYQYKHT